MIGLAMLVLGPLTLVAGAWRASTGLMLVGGLWFLVAFAVLRNSRRLRAAVEERRQAEERGQAPSGPVVSMGAFLVGTGTLLVAGLPAVAVGVWQLGIADADADWRWLPLVGGGLISGLAIVSAGFYLAGSGLAAVIGEPPTIPAEVFIVSMKQTGTYINEMPRIDFVLDVRPRTGSPYEVRKKATVPSTALGVLAVGNGFSAKVAGPDEPTTMIIDWDAPVQTSSGDSIPDRLRRLDELKAQGLVSDAEHDEQRRRLLDTL